MVDAGVCDRWRVAGLRCWAFPEAKTTLVGAVDAREAWRQGVCAEKVCSLSGRLGRGFLDDVTAFHCPRLAEGRCPRTRFHSGEGIVGGSTVP